MRWRRVLKVGLACVLVQFGLTETGILPSRGLDRTDWRLVEFTSGGVTAPATAAFRDQYLRFDGRGHFSGDFCNDVYGDVNVRWGVVAFRGRQSTLVACGDLRGRVEEIVFSEDRRFWWHRDGDRLTLTRLGGKRLVFVADRSAPVRRESQVLYDGAPDGRAHVFTLRNAGPYLIGDWYFSTGRGQGWSESTSYLSQKLFRVRLEAWTDSDLRPGEVLLGGFAPGGTSTVEYRATPSAEPMALTVHDDRGTAWAPFHGWGRVAEAGTVTAYDAAGRRLATCTFREGDCKQVEKATIG